MEESLSAARRTKSAVACGSNTAVPPPPSSSTTIMRRQRGRAARSLRQSTKEWVKQLNQYNETQEAIMAMMKTALNEKPSNQHDDARTSSDDDNLRPVNIIVLEGGGLRGHAQVGMCRGLYEKNGHVEFLQYFDLAGGSSVGGIGALHMNQYKHEMPAESYFERLNHLFALVRKRTFKKLNFFHLVRKGSLTKKKENSLAGIFEDFYGDTPLYNPEGLKAFALCAARNKQTKGLRRNLARPSRRKKTDTFEPFLARTYNLHSDDDEHVLAGSSNLSLAQALAATSALPVLVDRVELEVDGQQKRFADGGIFCNNPLAVAIMEARHLWHNRPIGTVVAFCLSDEETRFMTQAIEETKKTNPDLYFCRLRPPIDISVLETRETKLKELEETGRVYIHECEEIDELLERLKCSR